MTTPLLRLAETDKILYLEPGARLYVISGRRPGDDEDVTFTLCADDEAVAQARFTDQLAALCDQPVNALLQDCKSWGEEGPYITCTTLIGEILP